MIRTKNRIPNTNVNLEITFSDPLSFVLAKRFKPPLPVNAPDIPSDLPPCSNDKMIISAETIIINAFNMDLLLSFALAYYIT